MSDYSSYPDNSIPKGTILLHQALVDEMSTNNNRQWSVEELHDILNGKKYKNRIFNLTTRKTYDKLSLLSISHSLSKKKHLFEKTREGKWRSRKSKQTKNQILRSKVLKQITELGGQIPELGDTQDAHIPAALWLFSNIKWNKHHLFYSDKFDVRDLVFEEVEKVTFDPNEWKSNPWIAEHPHLYLIGSSNCIIATIQQNDMQDFPVYLIRKDTVDGPIQISKFLSSLKIQKHV